ATFYFLLTGSPPFTDGTVAQKLIWHQTKEPTSILALRPGVPKNVVAVVEKMMAKEPSNRYQKPIEVAQALASIVTTPIPPPPEIEMPRLSPAALAVNSTGSTGTPTRSNASPPTPAPISRVAKRPEPMPVTAPAVSPST